MGIILHDLIRMYQNAEGPTINREITALLKQLGDCETTSCEHSHITNGSSMDTIRATKPMYDILSLYEVWGEP